MEMNFDINLDYPISLDQLSIEQKAQLNTRQRIIEQKLRKTTLCNFYFRQRCLSSAEKCQNAHGLSELVRMDSDELLQLKKEQFNIKVLLNKLKFHILYNGKSRRFEHYKVTEIRKLRQKLAQEKGEINTIENNAVEQDDEEEVEEGGNNEEIKDEFKSIKKSVQNLNLDECKFLEWIYNKQDLHKFEMILLQDSSINNVKRKPRTKAELEIVRPWQNKIMASFLTKLFKESDKEYMLRSTVIRKYNESGVPITWARIASFKLYFEKKSNFPPWAPSKKVVLLLPLHDKETCLKRVEALISSIIQAKIDKELNKFKLPIRLADIQKEYNLQQKISDPPLFVVTKHLDVDMDTFFYKVLEARANIRNEVVNHLCEKYNDQDWAKQILEKIQEDELHMFMPFSHQSLIIRESIDKDLDKKLVINTICEQGQLYGHLATKYLTGIKNNDEFDKIIMECYIKYGYRLIKIGTGNYVICPGNYTEDQLSLNTDQNPEQIGSIVQTKVEEIKSFDYKMEHCSLCKEEPPNALILEELLDSAFRAYGEFETLTYHDNQRILIVNNYASLLLSLKTMSKQTSLGVDLEGRLRANGNINLIQIACEDVIYIFDMYQLTQLQNDEQLLQLTIQVLKCVFLNPSIRKVFFDGKRDLEALHFIIGVGIQNFYDAQAMHMTLFQLMEMHKNKKLFELKQVVTPGLNDVLGKHEVTHGVNSLKDKFKKVFDNYTECKKYFVTRPIDPDFVSYSAQDVEDLSELADIIDAKIDAVLGKNVHPNYRKNLVIHLSNTYTSKSCGKKFEMEQQPKNVNE
ncbi:3-5 exonuclease family protein [Stylonychia lemnae]|uniref:3-5 exonuclease family protein n=1 Tax=Stylonychia lemnae TaxID=5949 RepID=A0A078B750_STYLE|nr:3-5 exonuclease family protein [Stylonychia lemnae]|eukprot:CDW90021.1 3-5 exonuclease family protein [Stylonychia lemnae]